MNTEKQKLLTWKSLVFGILGIFVMSGLAGYHDTALGGTRMIGNYMPGGAFTYFIFLGLLWNGGWSLIDRCFKCNGHLSQKMCCSSSELIVIMSVTLVACFPPTSGLFRYFHTSIMMPWYYLKSQPDWITHGLLSEYLKPEFFPEPHPLGGIESVYRYDQVYGSFYIGLANGANTVPLSELPFAAWSKMMFWVQAKFPFILGWAPLLFLFSVAMVSLQFIVHRQWSRHEQLSYPIAQVAGSFCHISDGKRGVPDIFKSRYFWMGFVPCFILLMIMYLSQWYPQVIPSLDQMMPNLKSWHLPVRQTIPAFKHVNEVWGLDWQTLFFTILGISYFVSSEISLTMGVSVFAWAIFGAVYYVTTGEQIRFVWLCASRAGSYVGYALILIYMGRHYFKTIFAYALGLRKKQHAEKDNLEPEDFVSILAARIWLLSFLGFVIVFSWYCDSWLIAFVYSLLVFVLFLVISRIVSETGIPYIQARWYASQTLMQLMGPAAIGPKTLTVMSWSNGIFANDSRESLMPYVSTSLKVAEDGGIKLNRFFWIIVGAITIALVVAYVSTTYTLYNYGPMSDSMAANVSGRYLIGASNAFREMKLSGVFEASEAAGPLQRLGMFACSPNETRYFFYGMGVVIAFACIRFRFSKFPIHPVIFLVAGTHPSNQTWGAFLLGWFIKSLILKLGGGRAYQQLKPLFIGMISAELFMVGVTVLVNFLYYYVTGSKSPVLFNVLPG